MKYLSKVAGLLLLAGALVHSQVSDSASEKSKLIALENAWNQAQLHRDGQALNALVDDQFVYTDWDGTVMNKARFLADIKDPSVEMTLVVNDDVEVYLHPGAAIVTGHYHAKGKAEGRPFDHHGRFTDTWIRSGSQWVCVASHTNLMQHAPHVISSMKDQ